MKKVSRFWLVEAFLISNKNQNKLKNDSVWLRKKQKLTNQQSIRRSGRACDWLFAVRSFNQRSVQGNPWFWDSDKFYRTVPRNLCQRFTNVTKNCTESFRRTVWGVFITSWPKGGLLISVVVVRGMLLPIPRRCWSSRWNTSLAGLLASSVCKKVVCEIWYTYATMRMSYRDRDAYSDAFPTPWAWRSPSIRGTARFGFRSSAHDRSAWPEEIPIRNTCR